MQPGDKPGFCFLLQAGRQLYLSRTADEEWFLSGEGVVVISEGRFARSYTVRSW
jgi:hypothetical protein